MGKEKFESSIITYKVKANKCFPSRRKWKVKFKPFQITKDITIAIVALGERKLS